MPAISPSQKHITVSVTLPMPLFMLTTQIAHSFGISITDYIQILLASIAAQPHPKTKSLRPDTLNKKV